MVKRISLDDQDMTKKQGREGEGCTKEAPCGVGNIPSIVFDNELVASGLGFLVIGVRSMRDMQLLQERCIRALDDRQATTEKII